MFKRLKATSLVEVLIVLGIISTTIVASMAMVANSIITLRDNETQDFVNGVLIKGVEAVKSPSNTYISSNPFSSGGVGSQSYFRLSITDDTGLSLLEQEFNTPDGTCTSSSPYLYRIEDSEVAIPIMCLQIEIVPANSTNGQTYYEITLRVVYEYQNKIETSSLKTYRYEGFTVL